MNIDKIGRELGWQPRQSLESGLLQTVEWYLSHPEWVEAIRNQTDYQSWMDKNYQKRGVQQ
jgi:dTDP-glucose 4,6-dehydratase